MTFGWRRTRNGNARREAMMWHIVWHVVVGLGLIVIAAPSIFFLFIMSIFTTDKGGVNDMTGVMWGVIAVCAIVALVGLWLIVSAFL